MTCVVAYEWVQLQLWAVCTFLKPLRTRALFAHVNKPLLLLGTLSLSSTNDNDNNFEAVRRLDQSDSTPRSPPHSDLPTKFVMADTSTAPGQQADYPNLDPYGNSNGSAASQAETAKNKAIDSKVRHNLLPGISHTYLAIDRLLTLTRSF